MFIFKILLASLSIPKCLAILISPPCFNGSAVDTLQSDTLCTLPPSIDGWARACLTYWGVVFVDAACRQSNHCLHKASFFLRLPACCCYCKMDPVVARRVLSLYVYRD